MDYEVCYNFVGFAYPTFCKLDFLLQNLRLEINLAANRKDTISN